MKLKSPIITLIVGVLIAAVIYILSVNAKPAASYGAGLASGTVAVSR